MKNKTFRELNEGDKVYITFHDAMTYDIINKTFEVFECDVIGFSDISYDHKHLFYYKMNGLSLYEFINKNNVSCELIDNNLFFSTSKDKAIKYLEKQIKLLKDKIIQYSIENNENVDDDLNLINSKEIKVRAL